MNDQSKHPQVTPEFVRATAAIRKIVEKYANGGGDPGPLAVTLIDCGVQTLAARLGNPDEAAQMAHHVVDHFTSLEVRNN